MSKFKVGDRFTVKRNSSADLCFWGKSGSIQMVNTGSSLLEILFDEPLGTNPSYKKRDWYADESLLEWEDENL